jgi:hypothetical protein
VRRGDHDEAPAAGAPQRRPRVLREQEGAPQQQRNDRVEPVQRKLLDRRDVLDAGVRHDDVEPAEAFERGGDGALVALRGGQVGLVLEPGTVRIRLEVDRQDVHPFALESVGDGAPDPACRAGHERCLSCQAIGAHPYSLRHPTAH